jgi:hypothetical protein
MCEGQPKQVGLSVLRITAAAALGHADEPKSFGFPDAWRHGCVVHAVVDEILLRDWQPAVVVTAVFGKLDLDPGHDAMS